MSQSGAKYNLLKILRLKLVLSPKYKILFNCCLDALGEVSKDQCESTSMFVFLLCGRSPAGTTRSSFLVWLLTNQRMGCNKASAEPQTQLGIFHLFTSVIFLRVYVELLSL